MKKSKSKKEFKNCDWEFAMEDLFKRIKKIRKHIKNHDNFDGCEKVVEEMCKAERLWKEFNNFESSEKENKDWNRLLDYLKRHMRNWWD